MNHELITHFMEMPGLSLLEGLGVLLFHWLMFNFILFLAWCVIHPFFKSRDETPGNEP